MAILSPQVPRQLLLLAHTDKVEIVVLRLIDNRAPPHPQHLINLPPVCRSLSAIRVQIGQLSVAVFRNELHAAIQSAALGADRIDKFTTIS
jgi:hypothetical protein